jgi:hypothetical protein
MEEHQQELRIKLHILTSLARSQRALTHMLETVADISTNSKETASKIAENVQVISQYQRQLTAKISGISIRYRKKGRPAKPWINPDCFSKDPCLELESKRKQ